MRGEGRGEFLENFITVHMKYMIKFLILQS